MNMNLDIFLNKYCSEQTKSRFSLLHNKNYTTYQFLSSNEIYKGDNVEMSLYPHLIHITKIKCQGDNICFALEDRLNTIRQKYIEYVAYTPVTKVEAHLCVCECECESNFKGYMYSGNRLYFPQTSQYLDLRCDMK